MFYITYDCGGRLGNCVFPFFFCILIEMRYGYKYTEEDVPGQLTIGDREFASFFTEQAFLHNKIYLPPANLRLTGYFQYDWIFRHFKKQMIEYLENSPRLLSVMAKSLNHRVPSQMLFTDALPEVNPTPDDLVIHIRLDDYLQEKVEENVPFCPFSPDDYDDILKNEKYDTIYWVMKEPTQPLEEKYIQYLLKKWGGIYKPQTLAEDISLMRKAHRLVCSRSTLSWISSYLSPHEQTVYMPLKKVDWFFEQCPGIYPNTRYFDYKKCNIKELEEILNKSSE